MIPNAELTPTPEREGAHLNIGKVAALVSVKPVSEMFRSKGVSGTTHDIDPSGAIERQ